MPEARKCCLNCLEYIDHENCLIYVQKGVKRNFCSHKCFDSYVRD